MFSMKVQYHENQTVRLASNGCIRTYVHSSKQRTTGSARIMFNARTISTKYLQEGERLLTCVARSLRKPQWANIIELYYRTVSELYVTELANCLLNKSTMAVALYGKLMP